MCVRYSVERSRNRCCHANATVRALFRCVGKIAKKTISFLVFVRPSVCPHGTTRLPLDGLSWKSIFGCFSKIFRDNTSLIKTWQKLWIFYTKTYVFMIIPGWIRDRMRNVSDRSCRENQNTHFIFNNFFFLRKWCRLWGIVEKYGRDRQATDDDIIQRQRFASWTPKATNTQNM